MNETPTIPEILDDPAVIESDVRSVMNHFISGSPLDPSIERRVLARAERITSEVCRKLGAVDVAVGSTREMDDEQGDENFTFTASLATMAAMRFEIEKLREERSLYLDAFYEAKHAGRPAEPLPTFEELMRTTSKKINCLLDGSE